jgi:hypothetical protein
VILYDAEERQCVLLNELSNRAPALRFVDVVSANVTMNQKLQSTPVLQKYGSSGNAVVGRYVKVIATITERSTGTDQSHQLRVLKP